MRFPTFVDKRLAGEVLEDRFEMVPRLGVAAEAPIGVEGGEKGTAAALVAIFVLSEHFPFTRPTLLVQPTRFLVRPAVGDHVVLVHG